MACPHFTETRDSLQSWSYGEVMQVLEFIEDLEEAEAKEAERQRREAERKQGR